MKVINGFLTLTKVSDKSSCTIRVDSIESFSHVVVAECLDNGKNKEIELARIHTKTGASYLVLESHDEIKEAIMGEE